MISEETWDQFELNLCFPVSVHGHFYVHACMILIWTFLTFMCDINMDIYN